MAGEMSFEEGLIAAQSVLAGSRPAWIQSQQPVEKAEFRSVRQLGQRIRVAVQLIDANADQTIWSDRYDGDLSDIFAVQDEIASKAVNASRPFTQLVT